MPKVSAAHLEARRRQIIDAAVECFARDGFHRATMQDIVRQARLSPGAIYRYFESKADIIEAIADERHARERAIISTAGKQTDLGEALRQLAREFFHSMQSVTERRQRRLGIQIWAEALRSPRILKIVRRGIDDPRKLLARLLRRAQRRGEIPANLDAQAAASVMIAMFHGFILQQAWRTLDVEPYLAVIETALDAMIAHRRQIAHAAQRRTPKAIRTRSHQ